MSSARATVARLASRVPTALVVVIAIGFVLRLLIVVAVTPVEMNNVDSLVYVGGAVDGLFGDPVRPSGYSIFLRGLHGISADLSWTILVQHLIGIVTGCLLYATLRRLGGPVWVGVVGAAAVLLSLDQIYLEHSLLAESLFTLLLIAVLYCSVRALDEPRVFRSGPLTTRLGWIALAGLLLGACAWVRTVGVAMGVFLALWMLFAIPGDWRSRIGRAALSGACTALVVLGYFVINNAQTGYFGLTDGSGRVLLGRVSPFADCTKFDPPEGTRPLCETTPSGERNGADYYIWDENSPAWKTFGPIPADDGLARDFAKRAILAQPVDYVAAVASDTARHFVPYLDDERPSAGTPYDWMKIARRDPGSESIVGDMVDRYYSAGAFTVHGIAGTLSDLQDVLRVHQLLMLQALLLSIGGIWVGRGRQRAGVVLLIGAGFLLLLIPSITATYNARYAVPVGGLYIGAGALSLWLLLQRYAERVRDREPTQAAAP